MKIDADRVRIVEVGPRDGLQNEKVTIPLDAKVAFIETAGSVLSTPRQFGPTMRIP